MTERTSNVYTTIKDAAATTTVLALGSGLVTSISRGSERGLELGRDIGIGWGSFAFGLALGNRSKLKAEELAAEGKILRSRIKLVQAALEYSLGTGMSGAYGGYVIDGPKSALIWGTTGVMVGAVLAIPDKYLAKRSEVT